jgi:Peptidase family M23
MPRARLAAALGALVAPLLVFVVPPGTALAAPAWQMPFPCGQVWSGQTRSDHSPPQAVDLNRTNDDGDPVVAAAAGRVARVENTGSTSYGRWIEIDHGSGYRSRYAHLSVQRVVVGQQVGRGQLIGNVGSTGGSTGPHLHFEELLNGSPIRVVWNGSQILYYGTRNYTSQNCNGGASGTVNTAGAPLTVRSGPSTSYTAVGSLADGSHVTIDCQTNGQTITGTYGTTSIWDHIGIGYVSDAYVFTGSDGRVAPDC